MNDEYCDQIVKMGKEVGRWLKANPKADVKLQQPSGVMVAATISDALKHHFVQCSPDALRMFTELGWMGDNNPPTPTMIQVAIELGVKMKEVLISTKCPSCGTVFDAATSVSGKTHPIPGSFSICFTCGAGGVFDEELKLRKPNAKEQAFLDNSPHFAAIVKLIQGRKRRS